MLSSNRASRAKQAGIKLVSRQVNIQVELSKAGAKLAYSSRCYHAWHGYHSWCN